MSKLKELFCAAHGTYRGVCNRLGDPAKPYFVQYLIAAFAAAFFMTSALFMKAAPVDYTMLTYVESIKILAFGGSILAIAALLIIGCFWLKPQRVLPIALVVSSTLFCAFLQDGGHRNIWIGMGVALISYILAVWIMGRFEQPFGYLKMGYPMAGGVVAVLFCVFVTYMSIMGASRYYSFTYDTFDFGIFAQMFDYMKYTGLPYTTVERNQLLSHFAVHFSPFFYVLLPGYFVFSSPVYLCVMQTLFVGMGVFAVFGIAKHLGFTPKQSVLASAVYLLYPAISFGLHFDFHENKFLAFCVLFAVYFLLKRKMVPFYIFGLLICTVKEDAAIYLIAIALYMLLHERMIKHGLITLIMAFAYFVFAMYMIQVCGAEEGMQFGYRYSNFELDGEAGVGAIVKITLLDLGYTLTQIFQEEKVEFMLWMFLPVLFTPFMTKKISTLVLMAPMLLINLMSNWPYQHDVDYQYTYGVAALIMVSGALALKQIPTKKRNALLLAATMLCCAISVPRVVARNTSYINGFFNRSEEFMDSIDFIHETLDKDCVIGAEGSVVPVMFDYPCLYMDPRTDAMAQRIEFYVSKTEDGDIHHMTDRGFQLYAENGYIQIYKNPRYQSVEVTQQ